MSKGTQIPPGNGLSDSGTMPPENQTELANQGSQTANQTELANQGSQTANQTGQGNQSPPQKPKHRGASNNPSRLLTVEQYLKRAKRDQATADLVRSMHRVKTMSFADWEKEVTALLKKKVW